MKTKAIAIDNASKDDVRISASNGDCRLANPRKDRE